MGLILPYTFTGGTSAKAQEVNANFKQIQTYLDNQETVINGITNRYNILDSSKANLNGSENQQFAVAPATTDNQAISLAQLNERMLPFITVINGLYMSITTSTIFNTSLGGCYDSLYKYPISNQTSLPFNIDGYADSVYAVWIMARISEPSSTSISLTASESNPPSLIYDDTIYRFLGYVQVRDNAIVNVQDIRR